MLFVMGASGRVGGAVARALNGKMPMRLAGRRVDMTWFELGEQDTFAAALQDISAVFLMRPPQITSGAAFRPFLDACSDRGVRRIVVLSVKGADRNALLPHHAMEREVMKRDFDWTMLRPSDFMQNLETVHGDDIRMRNEITVPAGRGASAFVDVEDLGAAVARVLTENGHSRRGYALTGPEALTFEQVAEILSGTLGRKISYHPPSIAAFIRNRADQGAPLGKAMVMTALYSMQRFGGAAEVTNDLPKILGRTSTHLRNYVARERSAWR